MGYFTVILIGIIAGAVFTLSPSAGVISLLFLLIIYFFKNFLFQESKRFLIMLFIAGFAVRVLVAVLNYSAGLAGQYHAADTQPDAIMYNSNAVYIANVLNNAEYLRKMNEEPFVRTSIAQAYSVYKGGLPLTDVYQFGFYVYLLGVFYAFLGYSPIAAKILNGLFGSMIAIVVYHIAKVLLRSERSARLSSAVVMFTPSIIWWSSTLLQDTVVNFLFSLYILSISVYLVKNKNMFLLTTVALAILLGLFKVRFAPLFLIGTIMITAFQCLRAVLKMRAITRISLIGIISMVLLIAVILNFDYINNRVSAILLSILTYHKASVLSYPSASCFKLYKESLYCTRVVELNNFLDASMLFSVVKGVAYYFFSPFPWNNLRGHPFLMLFYPQAILTFIAVPFMILGVLSSVRRSPFATLSLIALFTLYLLPQTMAEGIIGNVVRHRDMFMPFVIIFSVYGFHLATSAKRGADPAE